MTLGEAFTKRFYELFSQKDISLYKFLRDNNIARSTVVNILNGKTKCPTLAVIYQVAYAFDMTPVEFLDCSTFLNDEIDYL